MGSDDQWPVDHDIVTFCSKNELEDAAADYYNNEEEENEKEFAGTMIDHGCKVENDLVLSLSPRMQEFRVQNYWESMRSATDFLNHEPKSDGFFTLQCEDSLKRMEEHYNDLYSVVTYNCESASPSPPLHSMKIEQSNSDTASPSPPPPLNSMKIEQSCSNSDGSICNGRPPSTDGTLSAESDQPRATNQGNWTPYYAEQGLKSEDDEIMDAESFPSQQRIVLVGDMQTKSSVRACIQSYMEKLEMEDDDEEEGRMLWELTEQYEYDQNRIDGVRLVQQLLACAEAVACRDAQQADLLLRQIQTMVSPFGDSLQRVTACFVAGLAARRQQLGGSTAAAVVAAGALRPPLEVESENASALMYGLCPYVPFGHFVANSAILEAVEGAEVVHVVDLGMSDGQQWLALIHGLASRPSGAPRLLRITGVGASSQRMQAIGKELHQEALVANLVLEFRALEQSLEKVAATSLNLRSGEALVVNSVLQLHCVVKESRGSLNSVLQAIHKLQPKVLTLVEQDASHNGPFFLGRFTEALHYYSAIFDALQDSLPRYSTQRVKIEQFHFGQEIKNIVACEGPARVERHERMDQWRRRMSRAGFQPFPLRLLTPSRHWLAHVYGPCAHAYTLSDEKGCLILGWKGKSIVAASAWRC